MRLAVFLPVLALSGLLTSATIVPEAVAQDQAAPLTCKDLNVPITQMAGDDSATFTLTPEILVAQCTSSTGARLTLITPSEGITATPAPGSSQTIPFIVKDDIGNTATANVIITRS